MYEHAWLVAVEHGSRIMASYPLPLGDSVVLSIPQPAGVVRLILLQVTQAGLDLYLHPGMNGTVCFAPQNLTLTVPDILARTNAGQPVGPNPGTGYPRDPRAQVTPTHLAPGSYGKVTFADQAVLFRAFRSNDLRALNVQLPEGVTLTAPA